MQPGPGFIIKCPHCGSLKADQSWDSGNTFGGATLWTDGGLTDCMMPPIARPFIKCYRVGCSKTFWIESAQMVERVQDPPLSSKDCEHLSGTRRQQAELWLELSRGMQYNGIDDCHQAIREHVAGRKKENWRWLRTFTWYESTNPFRGISELSFPIGTKCDLEERHLENLTELALLIDGTSEGNRLELVEIHRQRGDFSSAGDLLDFDWSEEAMPFVGFLRKLVASEDMILRRVPKQAGDAKTVPPED